VTRPSLTVAIAVLAAAGVCSNAAFADPVKIAKPRAAPPPTTAFPALPPAQEDATLEIGGDAVDASLKNTRLRVNVAVNGQGPYRFVVDSGADTSVVGLRIANDLQLPLGSPAILNSTTAREMVDRVRIESLSFGPSTIRNLEVPALHESNVGADGLIGIDALVNQRLMMDFVNKEIKVEDARKPQRHEPGEIVVTARRQRGQLILAKVAAKGFRLDAVIDTGSQITIGNSALRNKLTRGRDDERTITVAMGVTGKEMKLSMMTVDTLEIGPVVLHDVPIAFADVAPFELFGLSDEPALLLGTDVLESFRKVSLDFRARKVRFQLRKCVSPAAAQQTQVAMVDTASLVPHSNVNYDQGCLG
jgi:predicted aspartyl protease